MSRIELESGNVVITNSVVKLPMQWKFGLELGSELLKSFNPVPFLLNCIIDLQGLEAHRESLYLIFAELYSNALEHGVLGMVSDEKQDCSGFTNYYCEREKRLSKLNDGFVKIDLHHAIKKNQGILSIFVEDSGPGFDLSKVKTDLNTNMGHEGRGIPLLHTLCQGVDYLQKGNKVRAIFTWNIPE